MKEIKGKLRSPVNGTETEFPFSFFAANGKRKHNFVFNLSDKQSVYVKNGNGIYVSATVTVFRFIFKSNG